MKKQTKTEQIEEKVRKILCKGKFTSSNFNFLVNLAGHDMAIVIKKLFEEIWYIKMALGLSLDKRKRVAGKIKFIEGKGWGFEK